MKWVPTIFQTNGKGASRIVGTYANKKEAREALETVEQWETGKTWLASVWDNGKGDQNG